MDIDYYNLEVKPVPLIARLAMVCLCTEQTQTAPPKLNSKSKEHIDSLCVITKDPTIAIATSLVPAVRTALIRMGVFTVPAKKRVNGACFVFI